MAKRAPVGIRLLSRGGNDWSVRFPRVVEAASSCLIDGEVVCCNDEGVVEFQQLRQKRQHAHAFLIAFDLLELNGTDLRREPIETRKATLLSVLSDCRPGSPSTVRCYRSSPAASTRCPQAPSCRRDGRQRHQDARDADFGRRGARDQRVRSARDAGVESEISGDAITSRRDECAGVRSALSICWAVNIATFGLNCVPHATLHQRIAGKYRDASLRRAPYAM